MKLWAFMAAFAIAYSLAVASCSFVALFSSLSPWMMVFCCLIASCRYALYTSRSKMAVASAVFVALRDALTLFSAGVSEGVFLRGWRQLAGFLLLGAAPRSCTSGFVVGAGGVG